MNRGKLNKRITYKLEGTTTTTPTGGTSYTPGAEVETWCHAKPMTFDEVMRYGLPEGELTYKFIFDYYQGKNIIRGSELTYNDKTFIVNSVLNADEEKDEVIIVATQQV
jgi:head-tail adaptor